MYPFNQFNTFNLFDESFYHNACTVFNESMYVLLVIWLDSKDMLVGLQAMLWPAGHAVAML